MIKMGRCGKRRGGGSKERHEKREVGKERQR